VFSNEHALTLDPTSYSNLSFSLFLFTLLRLCLEIRDIWRPGAGLAGTRDSTSQGHPGKSGTGGNPIPQTPVNGGTVCTALVVQRQASVQQMRGVQKVRQLHIFLFMGSLLCTGLREAQSQLRPC